jgi:hypothetical protein
VYEPWTWLSHWPQKSARLERTEAGVVGAARASAAVLAKVKSVENFILMMSKRKELWRRNETVCEPKKLGKA